MVGEVIDWRMIRINRFRDWSRDYWFMDGWELL